MTAAADPGPAGRPSWDALDVERRLRQLELTVVRRLDGMLQGGYRGKSIGPGSEPGEGRLYRIGDDVRRMDWKLTARAGAPHVRDSIADRELEVWIVVDTSPSMDFGTSDCLKRDLALGSVAALGFLAARSGGRIGAVMFGDGELRTLPALAGRIGVRRLLLGLARNASEAGRREQRREQTDLADALSALPKIARHQGAVVVISDFLYARAWDRPLRALRARHDLMALEVIDRREVELPSVGMITVSDPETGRRFEVQTSRGGVRERYAAAMAAHRDVVATALREGNVDHAQLFTDSDWVKDIARFLARRRRTAWLVTNDRRAMAR